MNIAFPWLSYCQAIIFLLPFHSTPLHSTPCTKSRNGRSSAPSIVANANRRRGEEERKGEARGLFLTAQFRSFNMFTAPTPTDRPTGSNFKARARGKEDGMYEFGRSISTRFQRYSQVLSILQLHVLALSRRAQSSHALSIPWHAMSMSLGMPSPSGISSASPECGKLIILSPLK